MPLIKDEKEFYAWLDRNRIRYGQSVSFSIQLPEQYPCWLCPSFYSGDMEDMLSCDYIYYNAVYGWDLERYEREVFSSPAAGHADAVGRHVASAAHLPAAGREHPSRCSDHRRGEHRSYGGPAL